MRHVARFRRRGNLSKRTRRNWCHLDGKTSVYAHLQRFEEDLENYTLNQQYQKETYPIQLFPQKNKFYFNQGDTIGYSGNSGVFLRTPSSF